METRKVTIINNQTQSQKVITESKATTLGELKKEMDELGIPHSGMTFYEGHLRAELKDNASVLPTNIPYKGEVVNDLVFLLTKPEKHIKSGVTGREALYADIRANNLQEACIAKYGKNFTLCKNQQLMDLLKEAAYKSSKDHVGSSSPSKEVLDKLYKEGEISKKAYNILLGVPTDSSDELMSQGEIDKMFDFVNQ